jgi:hypothetical protein
VTTSYAYDVDTSLPNVLADRTLKYVYGLGLAYAVDGTSNLQVYHTDGLGSVRATTDANWNVVQICQTDEFAIPTLTQKTVPKPSGYTGQPQDVESGFPFPRARYHNPSPD